MRIYPLHYLNEDEFETLITLICSKILGDGVVPFAKGTDGGRDGRFHGKANLIPSETKPWEGKIVIQAKHTIKENSSCSDSDFQTILKNEVLPAIKRLQTEKKIDFYLLFTNRKLTGKQDEKIENLIDEKSGVTNIVFGNEKIQQWLQLYPEIVRAAKLNDLLRPLQFDESDLKEIIIAIHDDIPKKEILLKDYKRLTYLNLEKKNEINNLSKDFFDDVIKKNFIYFDSIKKFLSDAINDSFKNLYEDTIDDINAKINLKRNEYGQFEEILEDFYDYVINNNTDMKQKKRLVRVFLHYMYCNCDIGKKETS